MTAKLIRKYNKTECDFLFGLRNKNYVKKQSTKIKSISYKNHFVWFKNFIKSKKNKIFLIKKEKKNIGYIRLENKYKKYFTSWALIKQFHGMGIMSKNLKKITSNKKKDYRAIIKKNNLGSIKVAKNAGFDRKKNNQKFIIYEKNFL